MRRIIPKFIMNCEQATLLITRAQYKKLSLWDIIRLKWHNIVCPPCKDWEDHNKVITFFAKKEIEYTLSKEKKQEIRAKLKE